MNDYHHLSLKCGTQEISMHNSGVLYLTTNQYDENGQKIRYVYHGAQRFTSMQDRLKSMSRGNVDEDFLQKTAYLIKSQGQRVTLS